jgi:N-acyl amino acid synthase of PEP-CTERM/exosortase system
MTGPMLLASLRASYIFEVANTPTLVKEAQKLRYQVFVRERGIFNAPSDEELETDEFDAWSHHLLIRRCEDRQVVGTARLVPFSADRAVSLPIQRVCSAERLSGIPLNNAGEISRFALSKDLRRGGDSRLNSLLILTLVEGVLHLSLGLGLTHWCAVMERSLMRLLRSVGIHFKAVGPMVSYYGQRQPAIAEIASLLSEGQQQRPAYYDFVTHGPRPSGAPEIEELYA